MAVPSLWYDGILLPSHPQDPEPTLYLWRGQYPGYCPRQSTILGPLATSGSQVVTLPLSMSYVLQSL
eukprot:SAG11_NODE_3089_length_2702_cov_3.781022_1_plen_67_part_00